MGPNRKDLNIKLEDKEMTETETTRLLPSRNNRTSAHTMIDDKTEGFRMVRNIFVISIAFMVHFTASSTIGQLQSSINPDEGLGVYSRASAYAAMLFSSLFLPTYVIKRYSAKMTIIFSMIGFTSYMGAQFYPRFCTLIPTGVIMGLCAAPLWSAKSTYVTLVAQKYAELMKDKADLIMVRFFGIFSLMFQSAKIWGNILASIILSSNISNNESEIHSKDMSICGSNFCPLNAQEKGVLLLPPSQQVYTLLIVYVALGFAGVIIVAVFLESLEKPEEKKEGDEVTVKPGNPIIATFRQMIKPIQILIIPLTIWSGLEQGFFIADYYQAYVTCSWGVMNLGYVIIFYGICNALSSITLDPIIRRVGRIPIIIMGSILNITMIITLFKWNPNPNNNPLMLFVIAGIWGIADSVWQTQLKGLYGALFQGNEEAAFSNYTLWESLGFVIAFLNGNLFCVSVKLYSLLGVLTTGMIGYFIIEILERSRLKTIIREQLRREICVKCSGVEVKS